MVIYMDENSFILLVKRLNYELGGTKQSKPDKVLGGNVLHFSHFAKVNSAGKLTYDRKHSILHCLCFILTSRKKKEVFLTPVWGQRWKVIGLMIPCGEKNKQESTIL